MSDTGASSVRTGTICSILAAFTFGLGMPFAKVLLPSSSPALLAGLLYLGAGLSLTAFRLANRRTAPREAPLRVRDWPFVAGIVTCGGILAPVLMLKGLRRLPAVTSSLLLNLEAPLTILLAVIVFAEHLGRRGAAAAALIIGGGALLGFPFGSFGIDITGALLLSAACLGWAIDNNLTQRLSLRDPVALTQLKTLAAGTFNLVLALATGATLPGPSILLPALLLGAVSYGLSLVFALYGMRYIGAAREAAWFATAPFFGAVAATAILHETIRLSDLSAGGFMAAGMVLLLREHHSHVHRHEALDHEHLHVHDEHHQHSHESEVHEPHSHLHRHAALVHDHPHGSDEHHRHVHR
jgi:drug/metabolite transporter (DMT)-like permease